MAQPALNNLNIGPTLRTNSPSSVAPSTDLSASPLPPSINTLGVNCLNHADQASGPQSFVILNCEGISLGGSDFILDPAPVQASNLRFRRSVQDLTQPDRSHPDTGNLLTKTGELQFLF